MSCSLKPARILPWISSISSNPSSWTGSAAFLTGRDLREGLDGIDSEPQATERGASASPAEKGCATCAGRST